MPGPTYTEKYIVVFKDDATPEQVEQYAKDVTRNGGEIFHRYSDVLNGFSAAIPDQFLSSLKESDIIAYIGMAYALKSSRTDPL
ncbi:hypothetical protein BJ912DRAFT_947342 [Pholiota molesta]|nr:hypothetical protein BJ912DRAFT_947342 [Pholiota molesta]